MVKIYKQPFAHDGDAVAIPDASQPDGKMSNADGWTPDYQLPKTDPNYKPVGRQEMNGVFKEVTEALGQIQQFGFADWQNTVGGWPIGAIVRHVDGYWQSLANGNTEEPGAGVLWKELLFGNLVPADETIQGLVRLATIAESQALLNDESVLTPAKLAAAFGGANQGLTANGYQKLPSGTIIQWGVTTAVAVSNSAVATSSILPIAFPNNFFSVVGSADAAQTGVFANIVKNGLTAVDGVLQNTLSTAYIGGISYIAIGN